MITEHKSELMNQAQVLISSATSPDQAVSRDALRVLAGHGTELAGDVIAALRDLPPADADRLVPVVLRWPIEDVIGHLAPMLEERAPFVAVRAARALGRTHHSAAVAPLARMLDQSLRHAATAALGQNGSPAGIAPLRQLLDQLIGGTAEFSTIDENDPSVAISIAKAIQALGQLGDDSHAHWLIAILLHAKEPSARESAALALRDVPVAGAPAALASALTDSISNVRNAALLALWSYRTTEALDVLLGARLRDHLLSNVKATIYDVTGIDVAEARTDWMTTWSRRRAELQPATCLLDGKPITPYALIDRVRASERVEQAIDELELAYGLRVRWDQWLDEPAALIEEVEAWGRKAAPQFVPGKMYRFGREVLEHRLPR